MVHNKKNINMKIFYTGSQTYINMHYKSKNIHSKNKNKN